MTSSGLVLGPVEWLDGCLPAAWIRAPVTHSLFIRLIHHGDIVVRAMARQQRANFGLRSRVEEHRDAAS